jgi:hypothetical protein
MSRLEIRKEFNFGPISSEILCFELSQHFVKIGEMPLRKNHDLDTFPDSEDQIKKIDPKEVCQD